jgi:hypothetical protein
MHRICVFCGSHAGRHPAYREATDGLAAALVTRGLELVYGGGNDGLMGALADGVLSRGGRAIGVIPHALVEREHAHPGLTELRVVPGMHARKALMEQLADAFVALPGGLGTLEELAEMLTWSQLGIHRKPVGALDVRGFWGGLLASLDHAVEEGFIDPRHRALVLVEQQPAALLDALAAWEPPPVKRWLEPSES